MKETGREVSRRNAVAHYFGDNSAVAFVKVVAFATTGMFPLT